jgi:hypothetical protein
LKVTNPARNEVAIDFEGQTYVCRPTFKTVAAIEAAGGKSILYLGEDIATLRAPVSTVAAVLRLALMSSDQGAVFVKTRVDDLGDRVLASGAAAQLYPALGGFCIRALSGPERNEEEPAPEGDANPPS